MNIGKFFLFIFFIYSSDYPLSILFVLNRFPAPTKSIIVNQIISMIKDGNTVHIYARQRGEHSSMDKRIEKYGLLKEESFFLSRPKNLDKYDVILVQYGNLAKEFVQLKKKKLVPWKLVVYFRGADVTLNRNLYSKRYAELFEYGDLFLTVCYYFKYRLSCLFGCREEKIKVIPSGIDCAFFPYIEKTRQKDNIRLVSSGRLIGKKGIHYLVMAVAKLREDGHPIYLDIIGEGPYRTKLKALIDKFDLENYVFLHGWKNQESIVDFLCKSDIFVLPSVTTSGGVQEGISNALKEAMAVGRPVIGSYHAGTQELIEHGINGYLVPERDISILVRRILDLYEQPNICKIMGKNGRQKVLQEYDILIVNNLLKKVLYDLVNESK